MLLGPERRAHHVGAGGHRVGVIVDALVDHEVLRQALAVDALPFEARAGDRLQRLPAGHVDDVDRRLEELGDADRAVGGFAFDLRRARLRVALRPGDACLEQLLLHHPDEIAVLAMDGAERAEVPRPREAVHHLLRVEHDLALVGHEVLEAVDPVIAGQRPHVLVNPVVPIGDRDVEGVVGRRLRRALLPHPIGVHRPLIRRRDDEVDDHRGPAREAGGGAGVEVVAGHGIHKGQLHVGVRVDPPRHHQRLPGVDDRGAGGHVDRRADLLDLAVLAQDIGRIALVRGHDRAAPDQR